MGQRSRRLVKLFIQCLFNCLNSLKLLNHFRSVASVILLISARNIKIFRFDLRVRERVCWLRKLLALASTSRCLKSFSYFSLILFEFKHEKFMLPIATSSDNRPATRNVFVLLLALSEPIELNRPPVKLLFMILFTVSRLLCKFVLIKTKRVIRGECWRLRLRSEEELATWRRMRD